jgi:hypothetical protein
MSLQVVATSCVGTVNVCYVCCGHILTLHVVMMSSSFPGRLAPYLKTRDELFFWHSSYVSNIVHPVRIVQRLNSQ